MPPPSSRMDIRIYIFIYIPTCAWHTFCGKRANTRASKLGCGIKLIENMLGLCLPNLRTGASAQPMMNGGLETGDRGPRRRIPASSHPGILYPVSGGSQTAFQNEINDDKTCARAPRSNESFRLPNWNQMSTEKFIRFTSCLSWPFFFCF